MSILNQLLKTNGKKKKYFRNHIRYKKQFGHEFVDEYIRVKIKFDITINDEDIYNVMTYFTDENKSPKYSIDEMPPQVQKNWFNLLRARRP